MTDAWLRATAGGVEIRLKIVPGASQTEVAGLLGDRLKVRIAAPPADGQANRAIESFLSQRLGLPCRITQGAGSALKTILVAGGRPAAVIAALSSEP